MKRLEPTKGVIMLRMLAIAATFALALPTLAMAQANNNQHHPAKSSGTKSGGPPGGAKAVVQPRGAGSGAPGSMGTPHGPMGAPRSGAVRVGGPVGHQFTYRGHMISRVHLAPFIYPNGWAYRRWATGMMLPPLFLAPAYFYADWAALGVTAPPPGFQWVRYGPDLLLVNVTTGEVVDTVYDAFE
jgi:Ni/Co efflux regulator RcnB